MLKLRAYKPTSDWWCGNFKLYEDELVCVDLFSLKNPDEWRILVSGNDDYAFNRDFPTREEAMLFFCAICAMPDVTQDGLIAQGFVIF
jgi:hypothetical protein